MKGASMPRLIVIIVFVSTLLLFIAASFVTAQTPQMINYQGHLVDNSGKPIDDVISMVFTIYDDSTTGNPLWTESFSSVTVAEGLFSVDLSLESQPVPFNEIPNIFLGITVGSDPEISPRTRLTASPLSLRVLTIDGATGGTISGDLVITTQVTIGPNSTNTGKNAFVAGADNSVTQDYASISGGRWNWAMGQYSTVGGGSGNIAEGHYSTVGGGKNNIASGESATIPGGDKCVAAGDFSIAMGNRAKAWHRGSVVIVANECPL